ncbi:ATP-dependent helicase [Candidatus Saccharibacteria bacterium]|nr:ATP-dependent helicase [Candidatus Saccharibacteria bacterium]
MSEYTEALEGLNKKQLSAVEQIDGPVLVIAGPGTGKTQLLSTRVAHIINTIDISPSSILCLTFTNKAAVNMKDRIIKLAGQDGARVDVATFHSFAGDIMNSYPDYFWNAASLSIAPESLQLDIIESIVSKLPLDNPLSLKFAGQFTLLNDIQNSIKLAKDAGLTPAKLQAIIAGNLAYIDVVEPQMIEITSERVSTKSLGKLQNQVGQLPKMGIKTDIAPLVPLSIVIQESLDQAIIKDEAIGKASHTSAWKKRWVQTVDGQKGMFDERRRNDWWLQLAEVYASYRSALHERGFYDYADMLVETISQLEQTPEILADIQERYNYVMIDEFQDTNPAQMRLAHLVADHHTANGKPNLMAVGDDDQSIYKFNGAELNNMLDFRRSYATAKFIVLTDNYRSSQAVLDRSSKIIEQADSRLVSIDSSLNKDLVAVNPPKQNGEISAKSFSSRELQLSQVGRLIKAAYQPDLSIAVLARSHDSLIRMTGVLQGLDVPVRYEQQSNILNHEVVAQTYLLMRLLLAIQRGNKPATDSLLHQVIRHPMWEVQPKVLWQMALGNASRPNWLDSLLASPEKPLQTMGNWLLWQAQASADQPLAITVEQLLGLRPAGEFNSPLRDYYSKGSAENPNIYFHGLSAIQLLRSLVHEFSAGQNPSVEDFIRFIDINRENNRVVADESPFITGSHAVQLLTVHKAKGLEFDQVYIIDAIDNNWQPKKGGRKPPANLPLRRAQDDFDDFVRLMYVAATRAISSLYISAYHQDHAGQAVAISSIVQNAFDVQQIAEDNQSQLIEVLEENLRWPDLAGGLEREMLKSRLETYSLSVTALLNFLDVTKGGPQYFKERNLLRLPEAKTPSLSFGTAIHSALEFAQKQTNKQRFSLATTQKQFSEALNNEQMVETDFNRYDKQGHRLLKRLFDDYKYQLPASSLPEQNYKNIRLDKAIIGGKLDRVDRQDSGLCIVDYKTGRPLANLNTNDKTQAIKAYKHKTQLIFYALLASKHPSFRQSDKIECQMVYVEADSPQRLSLAYQPTGDDVAKLTRLVESVWAMIIKLELPDISQYTPDIDGIKQFEADLIKNAR